MAAPRHLPPAGKAEWRRITGELYRLGLLSIVDRGELAGYCQGWADFVEAERRLQAEGRVLKTENGYQYLSPWVSVRKQGLELMHKFGMGFGFNPAARSRIVGNNPDGEKTLAEILFGGIEGADETD